MTTIMDYPLRLSIAAVIVFWVFAHLGAYIRSKRGPLDDNEERDWGTVIAATLTLLGLIIGFSFSMAITRYDHRKLLEAEEANAIGTEFVRADLLQPADAAQARRLLKRYTDLRTLFYITSDEGQLAQIEAETVAIQNKLWAIIPPASTADPTPRMILVAAGMNDVLNSSAYTMAAWWNRLPIAAWGLMVTIAVFCNILVGYSAHRQKGLVFLILPLVVGISLLLIADIDSPRGGLIHVEPHNLISLSNSLHK